MTTALSRAHLACAAPSPSRTHSGGMRAAPRAAPNKAALVDKSGTGLVVLLLLLLLVALFEVFAFSPSPPSPPPPPLAAPIDDDDSASNNAPGGGAGDSENDVHKYSCATWASVSAKPPVQLGPCNWVPPKHQRTKATTNNDDDDDDNNGNNPREF